MNALTKCLTLLLSVTVLFLVGCTDGNPLEADSSASISAEEAGTLGSAGKTAVKIPYVSRWDFQLVDPGEFATNGGIVHIRDRELTGPVTGDIEGTFSDVISFDLNQKTGTGTSRGSYVFVVTSLFGEPVNGTFEGRFEGQIRGAVFSGTIHGQGAGDLAGLILNGTFTQRTDQTFVTTTGHVLNPRG